MDEEKPCCSLELLRDTEAALEALDKNDSREYRTAKEVVPGLVEKETPLAPFLQASRFDAKDAARRLASFWKYRKSLFGDRWLLPMTQTGTGALNEHDVQLLHCRCICLIPRENKGPLVIVDMSKATEVFNQAVEAGVDLIGMIDRCGVYCSLVFQQEFCKGETLFLHQVTARTRVMEFRTEFWEMMRKTFPIRLEQPIVAQSYQEGKLEFLEFARHHVATVVGFNMNLKPLQLYSNSMHNTARLLEMRGLARDEIPLDLGGNLNMDARIADWVRMRIGIESMLYPRRTVAAASSAVNGATSALMKTFGKPSGKRSVSTLLSTDDSKEVSEEERKRQVNALYVRRNYHKRAMEKTSLEDQKRRLEQQNLALSVQNEQLRQALSTAETLVQQCLQQPLMYPNVGYGYYG